MPLTYFRMEKWNSGNWWFINLHLLNHIRFNRTFENNNRRMYIYVSMSGFIPAKIIETFQSEEIANTVLYAIQTPKHVDNVNVIRY